MLVIRPAHSDDLPGLLAIRYRDEPAIHRDRISTMHPQRSLYLIALYEAQIVGFCLLLFERPPEWSDVLNRFPVLVDLFVTESHRCRGIGRALIAQSEAYAYAQRKPALFLSVEPRENPRAYDLYRRLGYIPLQEQPYQNVWRFFDSDGLLHEGEEWLIDMQKALSIQAHPDTNQ